MTSSSSKNVLNVALLRFRAFFSSSRSEISAPRYDIICAGINSRAEIEKIWTAARKLKDAGLKFGYTTSGSSVCGATWTDPLIIDETTNTIWEIFLVGGGC